ncbi:MAG: hypothetical protein AB7R55_07205 [Gemmatimonadales bacterium]
MLTLALLLTFVGLASPRLDTSLIGAPLHRIHETAYFQQWQLREKSQALGVDGRELIEFEPAAGAFAGRMSLLAVSDSGGGVSTVSLNLRSSFRRDPTMGLVARRAARDLMEAAIPRKPRAALAPFFAAPWYDRPIDSLVAELGTESDLALAMDVVRGDRLEHRFTGGGYLFVFRNEGSAGSADLILRVSRAA